MRKYNWVIKFYGYICADYIKNKPESAKDTLERILFLMQYDSLHRDRKPMLPYKIYIYQEEIRVRYISDLLRVARAMGSFCQGGIPLFLWRSYNDLLKYTELSEKYKNLTANQINRRVQRIIENETLDCKYFAFKKYENKRMRFLARLWSHHDEQPLLLFIWRFMTMLVLVPIVSIVPIAVVAINGEYVIDNAVITRMIQMYIGLIIIDVPWLLWTKKWTEPTKYELEMLRKQKKLKKK